MAETSTPTRNDVRVMPRRLGPLDGRYAAGPGVTLSPVAPRRRISLRVRDAGVGAVNEALGFDLPRRPKSSATGSGSGSGEGADRAALWLGPDEWLVLERGRSGAEGDEGDDEDLFRRLAEIEGVSAVDISHRNAGILIDGRAAGAVIAAGCPQDIRSRSFPVGAASRTVLGKAEIVLWHSGESRFEVECWRSFADYVWTFLEDAARAPAV